MTLPSLSVPIRLSSQHDLEPFDCGNPSLNDWLKRQAIKNELGGSSRTYVVCSERAVVGYYSLAAGAIIRDAAPETIQRNTPDPIPVMVLGRLAVDAQFHGQGIGQGLLKDAILRVLNVAEIAGVKALLVHAISDNAKRFYVHSGFLESPIEPMTLCLPLSVVRKAMSN